MRLVAIKTLLAAFFLYTFTVGHNVAHAQQTVQINAEDVMAKSQVLFTPASGTFTQGSTFNVPVYINTKNNNVGAMELKISFDPRVLSVVKPSGGSSVIGLWIEAPSYDNTRGTITFIGGIPRGITTSSGLIATITFQAKEVGSASVSLDKSSRILLNDGVGSPVTIESNTARYTVAYSPPGGVKVSSDTHPFHDNWYNNRDATFIWENEPGVAGYSIDFDNKPNTIPDSVIDTQESSKTFNNVGNGVWYFHIKASKNGVWGSTTHYEVKIDAEPPAEFVPEINYLTAAIIDRALVSFFTTDALSGMDYYEVGMIDKSKPATESPAFFRSESPYQVPIDSIEHARLIVRAFDRAGNVRDASIDINLPFLPIRFFEKHKTETLFIIIALMILGFVLHYFYGHHILRHIKTIWRIIRDKNRMEKLENEDDKGDSTKQGRHSL